MIVNTVVPAETTSPAELADPGTDEFAVAGRIGPDAETPRDEHSAKVELQLHLHMGQGTWQLRDNGWVTDLAQVGPDFLILFSGHGHIITAGTRGMLHVMIDGKGDPVEIELTTDVDFSTTRVSYRKLSESSVTSVVETSLPAPDGLTTEAQSGSEAIAALDTAISKAEQERLFWEEVRLLGELRESESDRDAFEKELNAARELQRQLQTELNSLSIKIPQLEQDLEDCCENTLRAAKQLWRLKQPTQAGDQPSPQPTAIEPPTSEPQPATLPAPAEESTEWRNLLTAELLAGIKGLGKKKLEAICELAPTVGHLEDLRGQASREHKQYNEVLPDGCGAGVAQMIEDRLVKHIADCAKRSAGGNPLADELLNSFRQKVASESWQATDCVPDSNDTEQTHLGFAAFNEGKPHTALPTQNPELARQWMLGWVCAEVIKHAPPAEQEAAKQEMEIEAAEEAKPPKKPRKPRAAKKPK